MMLDNLFQKRVLQICIHTELSHTKFPGSICLKELLCTYKFCTYCTCQGHSSPTEFSFAWGKETRKQMNMIPHLYFLQSEVCYALCANWVREPENKE
jgi:hypothetical protein